MLISLLREVSNDRSYQGSRPTISAQSGKRCEDRHRKTWYTYYDIDRTLTVLDLGLERSTERPFCSHRDIPETELLVLLKVMNLDI